MNVSEKYFVLVYKHGFVINSKIKLYNEFQATILTPMTSKDLKFNWNRILDHIGSKQI